MEVTICNNLERYFNLSKSILIFAKLLKSIFSSTFLRNHEWSKNIKKNNKISIQNSHFLYFGLLFFFCQDFARDLETSIPFFLFLNLQKCWILNFQIFQVRILNQCMHIQSRKKFSIYLHLTSKWRPKKLKRFKNKALLKYEW